ncbi:MULTISPECIES: S8 family serine peptidase [unclassified Streptomyces]|uniref:S8 family peptidase n=1 Tax=unclassified Streptomyces TaxID=2593676 RepID=UPI002E8248F9|nr:S8 family serine peptidase [Streptomyces sp. NBC_00589]WTI36676.1 S8 family peptidase [Streptomyces sp. NBC_00775]WUB29647.1 S8 family peptidase [Streptomyces sp. NBC_00589]
MRRQVKRACAATIATAAAVALAAGMTSPASAKAERASSASAAKAAGLTARHHITLITGDRVAVDAKGRVVGIERAKGRAHIPVMVRKADGHTLVVPADAQSLIATGKLDQRLFDVTELNKAATRKAQKQGLKLIVGYKGAATAAKADVREAGTLRRTLKSLNADAVLTPKKDAAELWSAVTNGGSTASGIAHVWLDGVRKASLDKSVPQIGAPKAWAAGYDGKGVKIAVLDTGVDATHPDLKDQVIAAKNFSTSADATDKFGHGTHVASIAAGTGVKSGGKYKGVAPGAKILSGKVLSDDGYGDDSSILAGMEWAADQGADVVNLSLGGGDTPEIDPLEAEVNKLSEEKGILFAIAAGNDGDFGEQTIGSPGSAADALTVGAVDDNDKLASFSSRGPGLDGAIKPDVTAPGVDITAAAAPGSLIDKEVGEKPPGYLTISGTSMATPHVAGAAAILKQEHPDWTFAELKGALTGSAKGGKYTPFQQGSGRIAVDKAIKQSVIADPNSVSFGIQQWPHTDDKPATKQLTYRNLGKTDVTLTLSATATNPKGQTAPSGFFTLGAKTVKVPAGGKASVDVTVNTKLGGTTDGAYSAYVTATGGGQSVRTAAAVQREVESYDVKLKYLVRDGEQPIHLTDLYAYAGLGNGRDYFSQGTASTETIRVPKGTYILNSQLVKDLTSIDGGVDWLVQPKLTVTKNQTVTIDQRTAKSADITVPDAGAKPVSAMVSYMYDPAGIGMGIGLDSFAGLRTAHIGPAVTSGLSQSWSGTWTKGDDAEYDVFTGGKVTKLQGAHVKHYKASELATVKTNMGAAASGKTGAVSTYGYLPDDFSFGLPVEQKLPGTRTLHVSTGDKVQWSFDFEQYAGKDADGFPITEAFYTLGEPQTFKAGDSYTKTFNTGVFGPKISSLYGVYRNGKYISGYLPIFADGQSHAGSSVYTSVKTTLYRNGTKIAENDDALDGSGQFKVPDADAAYKLTTSIKRSVKVAAASTRIDASWTFHSKKVDDAKLPISTARFGASLGLDSRGPADQKVTIPVTVQGAAAGTNLKSLAVYVSYDYGQTWTKLDVKNGKITFKNPAKGKGISFHAKIADKKGNKSTISIYNAYYGK